MLHYKFRGNLPAGSGDFKGFLYVWAWRPSWSCDQHHVIRFSFHCTFSESFHKNLVQIGKVFYEKIQFEFL